MSGKLRRLAIGADAMPSGADRILDVAAPQQQCNVDCAGSTRLDRVKHRALAKSIRDAVELHAEFIAVDASGSVHGQYQGEVAPGFRVGHPE